MTPGVFGWALSTIDRFQKLAKLGLLIVALLMLAFAATTLWPGSSTRLNRLGYHSVCPFAPWSSLFFVVCAGLSLAFIGVVSRLVRFCRQRETSAAGCEEETD